MREWEPDNWKKEWTFSPAPFALFIHTPLCGTCKAVRRMLDVASDLVPELPIHTANLNAIPELAQQYRIESVPCLIFKRKDGTWNKQYRFPSVTEVVERLRIERDN
jgi:hypothetical protein